MPIIGGEESNMRIQKGKKNMTKLQNHAIGVEQLP
jgi:hypothetical protein